MCQVAFRVRYRVVHQVETPHKQSQTIRCTPIVIRVIRVISPIP